MKIQSDDQYRKAFSKYLRALLAGAAPNTLAAPGTFGQYTEIATALIDAHVAGGTPAVQRVFDALAVEQPELFMLASKTLDQKPERGAGQSLNKHHPLPSLCQFPRDLIARGCPWLDGYIAFSRRWSPRAYDGFHRACGLWVLSTVAAGRVCAHFGGLRKTSVSIALTARSSLHAKTTTARIAQQVLEEASLDWLVFQSDEASPQKFLAEMAGEQPENYGTMSSHAQNHARRTFAFSGQKGWYYDEFGQLVSQISKTNGYMTDFRGILRWVDDNKRSHTYSTIGRGNTEIINPYLALLANMTPADLKQAGKRGSSMWSDGFWARFAFICPPADAPIKKDKFPAGRREIPESLTLPLTQWHIRLGEPEVAATPLVDKKGAPTGEILFERVGFLPECEVEISAPVLDAVGRYNDALLDLIGSFSSDDLNGNYARFPEKALRLSLLFASLAGSEEVRLEHYALAQDIVEEWRACLHSLVEQVNEPEPGLEEQIEAKILSFVERRGVQGRLVTLREIGQYVHGCSTEQKQRMVKALVVSGHLEKIQSGRTEYYRLPQEPDEPLEVEGELAVV